MSEITTHGAVRSRAATSSTSSGSSSRRRCRKLISEVQDQELKEPSRATSEQTRRHVSNVEDVFEIFGEDPEAEVCLGFEGLTKEHEKLVEETSADLSMS